MARVGQLKTDLFWLIAVAAVAMAASKVGGYEKNLRYMDGQVSRSQRLWVRDVAEMSREQASRFGRLEGGVFIYSRPWQTWLAGETENVVEYDEYRCETGSARFDGWCEVAR